jgi:hypothetical protein
LLESTQIALADAQFVLPNRAFESLFHLFKLLGVAHNGVLRPAVHRCSAPAIIDTVGVLTAEEKSTLSQGLNIVCLTQKEKKEAITATAALLDATCTTSADGSLAIRVPAQKFKKLSLGPFVGLAAQTVLQPDDPERTLRLPKPVGDPQLRRLRQLRDLGVFKKADKGASLVFLSKAAYCRMALKHLETSNYVLVASDDGSGQAALESLVARVRASGSARCRKLLHVIDLVVTRLRFMYMLPKIHKPFDDEGLYKPRPIVDCRGTALAAADKIAATFCAPLNKHLFTIAASSLDVVRAIRDLDVGPLDVVFYSADVSDLYTNVPIDASIDVVAALLDEFKVGHADERELVVQLLKLAFNNNTFHFADKTFRQVHGIPMGSNSAPLVADCFLFSLERHRLDVDGLMLFKRYRDDILAVTSTASAADELDRRYKSFHPRIKLESVTSTSSVDFLDIRITKFEDGSLRTGMFFKPTNSLPLLHRSSQHPEHVLIGAIKSRLLNYVRVCNNTQDLVSAFVSLASSATRFGYTEWEIIRLAADVVDSVCNRPWPFLSSKRDADDLRDYRTNNVVTFCRDAEPLHRLVRRRKLKLSLSEGKGLMRQLCRTKDH